MRERQNVAARSASWNSWRPLGLGTSTPRVPSQRLLADQPFDLLRDVGRALEELARVLASLAQPRLAVREEGARLLDQPQLDGQVEQAALLGDALVVHDVELGHAERRRDLVLDHLDLDAAAHDVRALLDGVDPPHVQPHRAVELQRAAAGRGLGVAEHDAHLLAQLVGEDQRRPAAIDRTRQFSQRLRHEPRLKTDVGIAHLAFELGPRHQRRHRVDRDHVKSRRAHQRLGNLERLLARVRLRDEQVVDVDA